MVCSWQCRASLFTRSLVLECRFGFVSNELWSDAVSDEETPVRHMVGRVSLVILLLLTPFIAFLEHFALGSRYVEHFCEQIGIHDELSMLYEPVIKFLMGW